MPGVCGSLTLAHSFIPFPCVQMAIIDFGRVLFYKSRDPFYWKEVSAGITYKTILYSQCHVLRERGL